MFGVLVNLLLAVARVSLAASDRDLRALAQALVRAPVWRAPSVQLPLVALLAWLGLVAQSRAPVFCSRAITLVYL